MKSFRTLLRHSQAWGLLWVRHSVDMTGAPCTLWPLPLWTHWLFGGQKGPDFSLPGSGQAFLWGSAFWGCQKQGHFLLESQEGFRSEQLLGGGWSPTPPAPALVRGTCLNPSLLAYLPPFSCYFSVCLSLDQHSSVSSCPFCFFGQCPLLLNIFLEAVQWSEERGDLELDLGSNLSLAADMLLNLSGSQLQFVK